MAICGAGLIGIECKSMGFLPDSPISSNEVMSFKGLAIVIDVHFLAIRKAHRLPNGKASEIETEDGKK